ncbi:MAG: hypothetical protein LUE11_03755 [Clostridia bacterium]|nr:hypothetical protein [Clostridia bacterium]
MEYTFEEKVTLSSDYEEYELIRPTESDLELIRTILEIVASQHHRSLKAEYAAIQREIDDYLDIMKEAGVRPWRDARFAGENPTPEEFMYYKGEKIGRDFWERQESLYQADRSGKWHSFKK